MRFGCFDLVSRIRSGGGHGGCEGKNLKPESYTEAANVDSTGIARKSHALTWEIGHPAV